MPKIHEPDVTEDQLMKAIEDLEDLAKPTVKDYGDYDDDEEEVVAKPEPDYYWDKSAKPANPNKYPSHKPSYHKPSYKRTAHPVAQETDAVVYVDEARAKIIVRAGFNADFLNLSRHLAGRLFVKKEGEEVVDGKRKMVDKYWEFDMGPENIKELLRVLTICYRKVSIPPLELLWMWDLLETDDMEIIYKLVVKRCPENGEMRAKVDAFFKKHIDITKIIIRASRRIELGDE